MSRGLVRRLVRLLSGLSSPWTARTVASFDEMDFVLAGVRCERCRRPMELQGEGPRHRFLRGRYRASIMRCPSCGRERQVHFRIGLVRGP